jgi:hypothetical protein
LRSAAELGSRSPTQNAQSLHRRRPVFHPEKQRPLPGSSGSVGPGASILNGAREWVLNRIL